MSIDAGTLVSTLSKIPFIGKPLVRTAVDRCTQRHRCDSCGVIEEVKISRIVENPLALLSPLGVQRHASTPASTPASSTTSGAAVSFEQANRAQEPKMSNRAGVAVVTNEQVSKAVTAQQQQQQPFPVNGIVQVFECKTCVSQMKIPPGRLGPHCYKGDSTNGDKTVLMDRILKIFKSMPEVLDGKFMPDSAGKIVLEDVHWVD